MIREERGFGAKASTFTEAAGAGVQAEIRHQSVRHGLIAMLPRLKRFADVLVGAKAEGRALLRRALLHMLAEQHRYERDTPLDRWAFAEIYRLWLSEPRDGTEPPGQAKAGRRSFEHLFGAERETDRLTASFLEHLPPQQRSTLLLVYGEGFSHDDAGHVLDANSDTIATRLILTSASFADRLGAAARIPPAASMDASYPQSDGYDRAQ
jgi:RNA polymerase sigma-70 factor (ECF subfamily)